MSRQPYRKGIDPGIDSVRPWIDQWYGDSSEIHIELLTIKVPQIDQGSLTCEHPKFSAAFRGKETPLHGMLKYAAYEWLCGHCAETPVYEQQIYSPIEDITSRVNYLNHTFDPTIPQLIAKGRSDVFAGDGMLLIADLYCERHTVEVGYTEPFNLFTPMLDDLADASIWIPFPRNVVAKEFKPADNSLSFVNAYKFTFA